MTRILERVAVSVDSCMARLAAILVAGFAILAMASGCEEGGQPAAAKGPVVFEVASKYRAAAEKMAERPEVDRISYDEKGAPIAVFFRRNVVANDDLAALADLPTLQWLELVDSGITDAGMIHLAHLPELKTLYLNNIRVGDEGIAHLAPLKELRVLHLGKTQVTSGALATIAGFAKLQELHLERTKVDDSGLAHLKSLTELQEVYLTGSLVTPEGVAKLKEEMPKLAVFYLPPEEDPIEQARRRGEEE
jgi:hypothetical protein